MRQETLGARDDGLLALAHDAQRVTECGGVVVLQAHDAARDRADVAFAVGERGERADGVVAAGDEVLQHQQVVVVRRADAAPNLRKFFGAFDLIDLSPAFDGGLGVLELCRVGRFGNQWVGELIDGKLIGAVAAVEVPGFRERDVKLLADLVEAPFLRDVVEQGKIDVRDHVAKVLQALLALREHAGVAVIAAQDEQRLLRMRPMNFMGDALKRVV